MGDDNVRYGLRMGDDWTTSRWPGDRKPKSVPAPQPDKALVEEIDEILKPWCHDGDRPEAARRLADRFGGWVSVPIVRLGKLKLFQHTGEGILVNSIDVIDECRRPGVLATLDNGKSDAQIYEDHGKTVSFPAPPEVK